MITRLDCKGGRANVASRDAVRCRCFHQQGTVKTHSTTLCIATATLRILKKEERKKKTIFVCISISLSLSSAVALVYLVANVSNFLDDFF